MIIKMFWPQCNFIKQEWTDNKIDSYWVECTLEEAKNKVFPYLSAERISESMKTWRPTEDSEPFQINRNCLCFLVSKDMESIEPFPWFYPYSGQWGAYCPFKSIKEIHIDYLNEILEFISCGL